MDGTYRNECYIKLHYFEMYSVAYQISRWVYHRSVFEIFVGGQRLAILPIWDIINEGIYKCEVNKWRQLTLKSVLEINFVVFLH